MGFYRTWWEALYSGPAGSNTEMIYSGEWIMNNEWSRERWHKSVYNHFHFTLRHGIFLKSNVLQMIKKTSINKTCSSKLNPPLKGTPGSLMEYWRLIELMLLGAHKSVRGFCVCDNWLFWRTDGFICLHSGVWMACMRCLQSYWGCVQVE